MYIVIPLMIAVGRRRATREHAAACERAAAAGESEPEVPDLLKPRAAQERASCKEACGDGKWQAQLFKIFVFLGYVAGIALPIQAHIQMNVSIQRTLSPAQRSSVLAADAFLAPMEEIFEFLEDTVTVRIGYALGAGRYREANRLLNAGVVLGLLSGCVGGAVATLLASSDSLLEAVVYPQGARDALAYPNCSLLERPQGIVAEVRPFFLLSAFQWPLAFANKVLLGFGLGCGQLWMWGWPMAIRSAALLGLWFGLVPSFPHHKLAVLGGARLAGPILAFAALGGGLLAQAQLRRQYGLRPLCCALSRVRASISDAHGLLMRSTREPLFGRDFLLTSLKAMTVDLTQQLSLTIGVYVAAHTGVATSYQIAAMQSAKPSYGIAWVQSFAMALKVMGSKEIAAGTREGYRSFACQVILFAAYTLAVAGIACVAGIVPYASAVGYHWGESACFYASEAGCAALYEHIFVGANGLGTSFVVFAFVAAANTSFVLLKAGCYATLDFDFMAVASLAALVLVFTPALLVAVYVFDASVASLYIAMYAPHFVLVPAFGARLAYNVRRMLRGEEGPWTTLKLAAASAAREAGGGSEQGQPGSSADLAT